MADTDMSSQEEAYQFLASFYKPISYTRLVIIFLRALYAAYVLITN